MTDAVESLLLMDMQRALLWMELEAATAEREERLGGWLSDHNGAMKYWDNEYNKARAELLLILKNPV